MVTTKLNLSMTEPQVRQIYAKQGDTGRVLDITLDQTPEDGTLRILRPDGTEVTSEAVTGGEVESVETVTFDSLTEADVTELTVGIEPVQDLSNGDPSPSNICPITGHDEVRATRTGKNLNPWQGVNYSASVSRTIWLNEGTYILSTDNGNYLGGNNAIYFAHYDANGNNITDGAISSTQLTLNGGKTFYYGSVRSSYVFTILKEGLYSFGFNNEVPSNVGALQLELGSTATSYEPYQANTYTTSLGQTVYGGTLDLVTGQLVVDKVGFNPQSSTFNSITHYQSNFNSTSGIVSVRIGNIYLSYLGIDTTTATLKAKTISTLAPVFSGQAWNNTDAVGKMGVVDGLVFDYHYSTIGLNEWTTDGSTTVNAFYNTFGSSLFIVAPLASPQTYQLTPKQIKTLIGTNNVWASSGDIVSIKFTYDGLLSELPSEATEIVGKCYCDVEQNGVSSMPFTLNVKKNERES